MNFANTVLQYVKPIFRMDQTDRVDSAIDEAISPRYPIKLPHLRRFVKPALLPSHLQKSHGEDTSDDFPQKDSLHFLLCATKH